MWLAAVATGLWAQEGQPVLTGDARGCFNRIDGGSRIRVSAVDVEGPGFSWAWQIETREVSGNSWDLRLRCFATRPAKKGDVGVAKYWIHSRSEGVAMSHFVVEQSGSPFSKSVEWTSNAGQEWKEVNVGFRWDKDYPGTTSAEQYNLSFWANIQLQEIEIGDFRS